MNAFDFVRTDKKIINIYNKISEFEDEDKGWAHHDFNHVNNVAVLTEKLLSDLNYNPKFIEEAKVASILHDTGSIKGKEVHALRSYEFAKQYIKDISVNIENNVLKINFLCDELINKQELEDFYFIKKVFKAITAFANKMNLEKQVTFNSEKWEVR